MSPTPLSPPAGRRQTRRLALAALVSGVLLLAGCAGQQIQTPEQVVAQRAEARWAALVDGDFEKAWTYTQPGYRAVVPARGYRARFGGGGQWLGAQVHGVTCEPERCTVQIRLETEVILPGFRKQAFDSFFDEAWVREDGQWWYYQAL